MFVKSSSQIIFQNCPLKRKLFSWIFLVIPNNSFNPVPCHTLSLSKTIQYSIQFASKENRCCHLLISSSSHYLQFTNERMLRSLCAYPPDHDSLRDLQTLKSFFQRSTFLVICQISFYFSISKTILLFNYAIALAELLMLIIALLTSHS